MQYQPDMYYKLPNAQQPMQTSLWVGGQVTLINRMGAWTDCLGSATGLGLTDLVLVWSCSL